MVGRWRQRFIDLLGELHRDKLREDKRMKDSDKPRSKSAPDTHRDRRQDRSRDYRDDKRDRDDRRDRNDRSRGDRRDKHVIATGTVRPFRDPGFGISLCTSDRQ